MALKVVHELETVLWLFKEEVCQRDTLQPVGVVDFGKHMECVKCAYLSAAIYYNHYYFIAALDNDSFISISF